MTTPWIFLNVRHKVRLFRWMLRHFVDGDTVSFEGWRNRISLPPDMPRRAEPHIGHSRQTLEGPNIDFVVLNLSPETVRQISKAVGVKSAISDYGAFHTQIVRNDRLVFWSHDAFEITCIDRAHVTSQALDDLKERGIIRRYSDKYDGQMFRDILVYD